MCICSLFGGGGVCVCYLSPGCIEGIFPTIGTSVVLAQHHTPASLELPDSLAPTPSPFLSPCAYPAYDLLHIYCQPPTQMCHVNNEIVFQADALRRYPDQLLICRSNCFSIFWTGKIIKVMTQRKRLVLIDTHQSDWLFGQSFSLRLARPFK